MIEKIKGLQASDGSRGWPVAVRDRIAYKEVKEANVAITFLWTMRDAIVPKLDKENLAIAANFYTPAGLEGMVRNILGNPYIRYIILLGEEYSPNDEIGGKGPTSANAIRAFFEKGLNAERELEGFQKAVHFDKNIPIEMINKVRESVQLIDLNKKMPSASFDEKVAECNRLLKALEKKLPFLNAPLTFGYEPAAESFPYEGGPLIVRGTTIPKTWIEIMHQIYRYGKDNLMDANTDRKIKEINGLTAVISEPQSTDLSVNPFLVPMTAEKIKAYQQEVLSSLLPEGKAYTYGNKLRAYFFPDSGYIKSLVTSKGYRDFEFGQGPHIEQNITYLNAGCNIDQIRDMADALKRNLYLKSCVAITWHVQDELMRKHKSSPCLVLLQALVQDEKLNLTVYFRSHDMVQGWPENAYGCAAIQKEIADAVGIQPGIITIISCSAQIYRHYYAQVDEMLKKHRKVEIDYNDPRGNYSIAVKDRKITVSHLHPDTNREMDKIEGKGAGEICLKLAERGEINTAHAIYLGAELARAENALKSNLDYEQDREQ